MTRRLGSEYVDGVPTPYAIRVHPYPTRFHGGIWSRPTFEFPEAAIPSTVFLPPRDIDMIPDRPASGYTGMGEVQYDVGEGIFRPGGYGGGVFDGNLAGAPALGHASTLGDAASDATNYPMGKYSAQTLQLQNALNAKLIANGFCPMIADGKLGPATCGAAMYAGGLNPGDTILWPATCTDFKQLTPVANGCGTGPSGPTTSASVVKASAASASASSSLPVLSSSTKKALGFLAGGLAAIGIVYYVKKRRG